MTIHRVLGLAALAFVTTVAGAADPGRVDPAWVARAKTEVAASLKAYEAAAAGLDEVVESRIDPVPGEPFKGQREMVMRTRTARLGANSREELSRVFDDPKERPHFFIKCDNADYSFKAGRSAADAPATLIGYQKRAAGVSPLVGTDLHLDAHEILGHLLKAVDGENRYTLNELAWDAGKSRLHAVFTVQNSHPKVGKHVYDAWVEPGTHWKALECKDVHQSASNETSVTYGKVVGGLPYPTETRVTFRVKDVASMQRTTRLISLEPTALSPRDFTLSAFGLPEPADVTPQPRQTPAYVWVLAAAAACAVLAGGFRVLAGRRRAAAGT